ncbi:N-acetylneuraminate epimerase [Psychromonas hadalis]|uniref:N-acetylneuraminate epimerase n=1 Tax=Psychromonas hadalis TaxID=211669 RepID=UPI0003B52689|nr:N-acetylneuraminate epimerase [Psychromonas hadalis]
MKKRYTHKFFTPLLTASLILSSSVFANDHWPDLPIAMKSGISAQVGDKLYVGLGSAGQGFYMLDLADIKQGWQKKSDFSGPVRNGATASVVGNEIYIFGGAGKQNKNDAAPILFDTVYRYDVNSDLWGKVDTITPVGLLGSVSYSPDSKQVIFFGGYNKNYFDQYLADINATNKKEQPEKWQKIVDDYMGMKPINYKWNSEVLSYTPKTGLWTEVANSPYLANCGSALVTDGAKATIISGEIKPGLRTAEVKRFEFGAVQPWKSLHDLPKPTNQSVQEGVAGAFAGKSNGVTIVAGGANFHGAKGAFEQGNMFAHNGFGKAFNPETYVLEDGLWSQSTDLPHGLAYGASFTIDQGVLIIGGEDAQRAARKEVYLLSWDGKSVKITD